MKLSSSSKSKPLSSPGRTDKFPPPLMRFLRSNVSSKSRGRSRATPLFMRKWKSITSSGNQGNIETQEPSSPKVTCIGQVKIRRSKNKSKKPKKPKSCMNKNQCCCFPKTKTRFCDCKLWKPKWPKWVYWFSCCGVRVCTKSSKNGGSSARFEDEESKATTNETTDEYSRESTDVRVYERGRRSTSSVMSNTTTTPPKNALMLTRCRSAPYRSSSLACRFWGDQEDEETAEAENKAAALGTELIFSNSRDSTSKSRGDDDDDDDENTSGTCSITSSSKCSSEGSKSMEVCAEEVVVGEVDAVEQGDSGLNAVRSEGKKVGDDGKKDGEILLPKNLMLMRCKSEPARRGLEKFDPQSSEFWRHRRLGNTENCTPHAVD